MEDSNLSYKQLHEKFMQNHTGTSIEETVLILTPMPFAIFIAAFLINIFDCLNEKKNYYNFLAFILEFVVLVVSQIVLFMVPVSNVHVYVILIVAGVCITVKVILTSIQETFANKESTTRLRKCLLTGRRPYITYFRTSVNLITTVCILAVDFTSFPRKLAKTENYGFSLMDTGVGFFVVCNGLVGRHLYNDDIHNDVKLHFLFKQLKQNFILICLGLLRVISTKSVDYQNHNSEYGVHWNFFITLAFTRIFSAFILTFVAKNNVKYLAFIVTVIHQTALSLGLEFWVLSNVPRDNFILANREGIVSLLGYVSLYLISVELGNSLSPHSTCIENDAKLVVKLIFCTIVLYVSLLPINKYLQCSRRLANIAYILWIIMLTVYLLALCLLFELILRIRNGPKKLKDDERLVPSILLSINFNALSYFLLSNLFTGIINLSIKTLYVSEINSIFILVSYMFLNCCITKILHHKKIKLL